MTTMLQPDRIVIALCLILQIRRSDSFVWYEKNYSKSEADTLLATAVGYWSMNDDLNVGITSAGSSLIDGPIGKALRRTSGPHTLSTTIPSCIVNSNTCNDPNSQGFTISLWYSLRPDGGVTYDDIGCLLLAAGEQTEKQIKIKYEGGPEHNISYTVPRSDTVEATIHTSACNMPDPRYDVCTNWDTNTDTCINIGDTTRIGWQWNNIALVYSGSGSGGFKAYYNTYELRNVTESHETTPLRSDTSDTKLSLYPNGGCGLVGFDEVAYWSRALTQDEIAVLRLGPFGVDGITTTAATVKTTTAKPTSTTADEQTTANAATSGTTSPSKAVNPSGTTKSNSVSSTKQRTSNGRQTTKPATTKRGPESVTTMTTATSTVRKVNVGEERHNIKNLAQTANTTTKSAKEAKAILEDVTSIVSDVSASTETYADEESDIADEIVSSSVTIVKAVAESTLFADGSTSSDDKLNVRQQCLETLEISSTLANQISYTNSSKKSATALGIEEAMTTLLKTYLDDPTVPTSESIATSKFELKFRKIDTTSGEPIKTEFTRGSVEIKSDQYTAATSEARLIVAEISDVLQDLLPTSVADTTVDTGNSNSEEEESIIEYQISSVIYDVILSGVDSADFTDLDITLTMETDVPATDRRKRHCSFLDLTQTPSTWSNEGISVHPSSTEDITICRSTHLTNFAVLMSVNEIPLTEAQEVSLSMITYVGCTLSLICLLFTIILLFVLRELNRSTRIAILKHLAISMFIAQLLFLAGVETAVGNPKLCTTVAVFLHYFFLTVMCWMLSQGLYLYVKLRRSAKGVWDFAYFCVLGWGFPIVLVGVVAGIKYESYGTDKYCWLSTEGGAIWAFVGPVLAIIAVNTVVMILAMKAFTSVKVYKDKSDKEKMRSSLRAVVVMLPILGLTWIFGVFSFNKETLFFQYLFAILNSLQGVFLFVFNILWNDEVKGCLRRKVGRKLDHAEKSSMFFNRVLGTASVGPSKSNIAETSLSATTSTGTKM